MGQDPAEDVRIRISHQHLSAANADAAGEVVAHEGAYHIHVSVRKINQTQDPVDHRITERDRLCGNQQIVAADRSASLFKLGADGKTAVRVPVKVGRASVNSIQVVEGLQNGDTVILSDMSRWDNTDRIRLN